MALSDRLTALDKQQLLNLRTNARRLQDEGGPRGEEAKALLPLIEAELSQRTPPPSDTPKTRVKRKPAPKAAAVSPARF